MQYLVHFSCTTEGEIFITSFRYFKFQSALGYEHHEELAIHDSQKGIFAQINIASKSLLYLFLLKHCMYDQ